MADYIPSAMCVKCRKDLYTIEFGRVFKCPECGEEIWIYPKPYTLQEAINKMWENKL